MSDDPLANLHDDIAWAIAQTVRWRNRDELPPRVALFFERQADAVLDVLRARVPGIDHLIAGDIEQILTERGWARIHLDESLFIDRVVWVAPATEETP